MLVYGDAERPARPAAVLAEVEAALAEAGAATGLARHGALVDALIAAGKLAQGVADALFAARGDRDARSEAEGATLALLRALARAVASSWDAGFAPDDAPTDDVTTALVALNAVALPEMITLREPEGFAHYAVYPESFLVAARAVPGDRPVRVIGIRSIGTTLGAMAAEGAGAASLATVRPIGHPFRRRVAVAADRTEALAAGATDTFAVVDEGPGLSGSSVAAVADHLREAGVPPGRIHVLPSHGNPPGAEAEAEVRAFWAAAPRHLVTFDDLVLRAPDPRHRLERWFADLVGSGTLAEISGGGWRAARGFPDTAWPPAHPSGERRKFLLRTGQGTFLLRFAGLGGVGARKFAMAETLSAAGFVPEPLAFRHGFVLERWLGTARPLPADGDRGALVARLGRYLGFRACAFPAASGSGATAGRLLEMLARNAGLALGPEAAAGATERWGAEVERLEALRRPVLTDNRLHRWEWLVVGDAILKADAVDHHAGHDLVGPQDIAWDLAGAAAEFALSEVELDALARAVARPVDPRLLAFLRPCYVAFQLGSYTMAAAAAADAAERGRLEAEVARYCDALARALPPP